MTLRRRNAARDVGPARPPSPSLGGSRLPFEAAHPPNRPNINGISKTVLLINRRPRSAEGGPRAVPRRLTRSERKRTAQCPLRSRDGLSGAFVTFASA
ncbi:Hypothetical protein NTJ_10104 [Nesidiocoris tenuis]|uniref:Uncharacterized protein n=1 Tax=Nesidiocoris tenuis TaxID=355587 RepID=A0ABN7B279_9HEMI|nr:Hypothetical protein NTJ_10104 [Nesidiocoris tenuis]